MGVLNSTRLLSREGQTELEMRREAQRVYWMSAILSMPVFGFAAFRLFTKTGFEKNIGYLELLIGIILISNCIFYYLKKRSGISKPIVSSVALFLSITLIMSGGTQGSGIYWAFVLQSTNFPFLGLKQGSAFSVIIMAVFGLMGLGQHLGLYETAYALPYFTQGLIILFIIAALGLITEKVRVDYQQTAAKQRERMRVLLEELPTGVILLSAPEGRPIIVNGFLERMLGSEIKDDIDLNEFVLAYGLSQENGAPFSTRELSLGASMASGIESSSPEVFIHRKDGSEAVVSITAAPIKNSAGEVTSVVGIFEDQTKRHEVDKMKSELVSLASHQLKTPMTSIKWTVETLLEDEIGDLNDKQISLMKPILETVNRLANFINDLLVVSRIETGRKFEVTPEPSNVVPVIMTATDKIRSKAEKLGVELKTELPDTLGLMADRNKLGDLMVNLIDNAVKYSRKGGVVTIRTEKSKTLGTVLVVEDNGIGIPNRDQKNIFERFFRASNVGSEIEGSGLGLYISKVIAERHGGRIWFNSTEGKGTTFYLFLKPAIANRA